MIAIDGAYYFNYKRIIKKNIFQVKNIEDHPLEETTIKSQEYYLPHSQNYDGTSQHRNQIHLHKSLQENCGYVSRLKKLDKRVAILLEKKKKKLSSYPLDK